MRIYKINILMIFFKWKNLSILSESNKLLIYFRYKKRKCIFNNYI